jgi:hypothetical protein
MYTRMYISSKWSTDQHTQASKTHARTTLKHALHHTLLLAAGACCRFDQEWEDHCCAWRERGSLPCLTRAASFFSLSRPRTHAARLRCSLLTSALERIDGALPLPCRASRATLVNQLSTFAASLQARFVPCPSAGVTAPCCFAVLDQAVSQRVKTCPRQRPLSNRVATTHQCLPHLLAGYYWSWLSQNSRRRLHRV